MNCAYAINAYMAFALLSQTANSFGQTKIVACSLYLLWQCHEVCSALHLFGVVTILRTLNETNNLLLFANYNCAHQRSHSAHTNTNTQEHTGVHVRLTEFKL